MNSVHDSTKDWQPGEPTNVPLQYTPMDHHGYSLGAPVHPSNHHQHQPYPSYQGKSVTELRMSGPSKMEIAPARTAQSSPTPYRKRSRSDSLFSPESGPFFSSTKLFDNLFAMDRTSLLTVQIDSKMDRGFFLANDEWTCYRRNYFQVSSAFLVHGVGHYYPEHEPPCLVRTQDGMFHPVRGFVLGISARVSNSEKRIELVQHTAKRDKGPQMTPRSKPIIPGGNLNMSAVGTNQNIVTFERIQFKTATANNGKRRAAQQYYVCVVELFAENDSGEQIRVASCQSASLVVRGRSPGHYTDSHQDRATSSTATASTVSPHHDRFYASRPPYTHPAMGEYNHYSPYYPAPPVHTHSYMSTMVMPPTSAGSPTSMAPPPQPQPQPNYHTGAPYMVAGMTVSSPQSSHYPPEFAAAAAAAAAAAVATVSAPPQSMGSAPIAPVTGGNNYPKISPNGCIESPTDWSRSRINSTGSLPQSYFSAQGTPTLSSAASQTSAFSPTTPTTPYGNGNGGPRKYSAVSNICNQQSA